jgi:hypothetical protein
MNADANKGYCKLIFFSHFLLKVFCKVTLSTSNSKFTEYVTKRNIIMSQHYFYARNVCTIELHCFRFIFLYTKNHVYANIKSVYDGNGLEYTKKVESGLLKLGKRIV